MREHIDIESVLKNKHNPNVSGRNDVCLPGLPGINMESRRP